MKPPTFAPPGTDLARHVERNRRGRDLVVGDIHGHFATLRRALAELEVGEHDRVFSLGDLVDRGPDSWAAKDWMAGTDPWARFNLVLRGNHEQMMLAALVEGPTLKRPDPLHCSACVPDVPEPQGQRGVRTLQDPDPPACHTHPGSDPISKSQKGQRRCDPPGPSGAGLRFDPCRVANQ